ncbi:urease accessory protein UreG [Streptomyces sp. INA 01156]
MHLDHTHQGPGAVSTDAHRRDGTRRALRIGLGGPVGSGKTATVAALCRALRDRYALAVVTNDIYTREDAEFLLREAVLPPERITAVETGACPHTAIRDDISANLEAVEELEDRLGPLDLILVESGGDNLTATFSKGLVDTQIFVIDVSSGDDIPARAAPASPPPTSSSSTRPTSPHVGADLDTMASDAAQRRGDLPVVFTSLISDDGVCPVADWVLQRLTAWRDQTARPEPAAAH